jgi:RNA polymerase sigma-70 factor (ECF subfamily)
MAIETAIGEQVPASDGVLVRRVREGDKVAFKDLYDRLAPLIRAVCFSQARDLDVAGDLAQEAFFRAYARLHRLADPEKFGPWLLAIARRVCREWRRGRLREKSRMAQWSDRARTVRSDCAETDCDDSSARLREAMASMPERERLALHAFYLQQMTVEQAREALGLSRSGFYHVLSCARQRLRRLLASSEVVR